MALNPYSRENSTYMPVGEPKRNDDVVSKYKSEGFDNEVEGVIFAMLMQYAKTDSENAEKRARQFAKILYEYSTRLINDLDVSNSVIAQKIANAIDGKISTELKPLSESVDFETEISEIKKNVSDYLTSLVDVANGNLVTSGQLGLSSEKTTAGKNVPPRQQREEIHPEQTILPESFIELIQREAAPEPDLRGMTIYPRELTLPVQQLAKNAATLFGKTITAFTDKLATNAVERLGNIQKSVESFGQAGAFGAGKKQDARQGGGISDSHQMIKITAAKKDGGVMTHLTVIRGEISTMMERQEDYEKNLKGWVAGLNTMKKEFDRTKDFITAVATKTVQFAAGAFKTISKNVKSAYNKVKKGGFFNFMFSPMGILTFGLLGWAGYKLIFSGIGDKIKSGLASLFSAELLTAFPLLAAFLGKNAEDENAVMTEERKKELEAKEDDKLKTGIFAFLDRLQQEKDEGVDEEIDAQFNKDEDMNKDSGFFHKLFGFVNDEYKFYSELDFGKNGIGGTMDQITDHWLENIKGMDKLADDISKKCFGVTLPEWLESLGQDKTEGLDKSTGDTWIDSVKTGMKNFWDVLQMRAAEGFEWFKGTEFGQSVMSVWDAVTKTCQALYAKLKPWAKIALKASPFIGAVAALFLPPIGPILAWVSRLGKLFIALGRLSFIKPVMGAIGSLIQQNPMMALMIIGAAIGLGALAHGIWNIFNKKVLDNGGLMPREQYAISMGLAKGQEDKYGAEYRLSKWTHAFNDVSGDKELADEREKLKAAGLSAEAVSFITRGISQFEENYRFAMENQDKDRSSTLHWFILNRRNSIAESIWARRLAEMPILGIGEKLVHESLYYDFIKQLDKKFPDKSEHTWDSVRQMLMRMKDVDTVFRHILDVASPEDIVNFINTVNTDQEKVKKIYEWTHNGGQFDLAGHMRSMFGENVVQMFKRMPRIGLHIAPASGTWIIHDRPWDITVNVNGRTSKIRFPSVKSETMDDEYIFKTLFSNIAENVTPIPIVQSVTYQGETYSTVTGYSGYNVTNVDPVIAARAFVNYMNRQNSSFRTLYPWNLSAAEAEKLKLVDNNDERLYKMKDLVKGIDKLKNMRKIDENAAEEAIKARYEDLPNYKGQEDSKAMIGMIYVLGTILQLCDEIDRQ